MKIKNIALVGNPNCGKTSLFNTLTGTRQKVANYAGVTVERKKVLLNYLLVMQYEYWTYPELIV
jgi:ferrous iron transport protein B